MVAPARRHREAEYPSASKRAEPLRRVHCGGPGNAGSPILPRARAACCRGKPHVVSAFSASALKPLFVNMCRCTKCQSWDQGGSTKTCVEQNGCRHLLQGGILMQCSKCASRGGAGCAGDKQVCWTAGAFCACLLHSTLHSLCRKACSCRDHMPCNCCCTSDLPGLGITHSVLLSADMGARSADAFEEQLAQHSNSIMWQPCMCFATS